MIRKPKLPRTDHLSYCLHLRFRALKKCLFTWRKWSYAKTDRKQHFPVFARNPRMVWTGKDLVPTPLASGHHSLENYKLPWINIQGYFLNENMKSSRPAPNPWWYRHLQQRCLQQMSLCRTEQLQRFPHLLFNHYPALSPCWFHQRHL